MCIGAESWSLFAEDWLCNQAVCCQFSVEAEFLFCVYEGSCISISCLPLCNNKAITCAEDLLHIECCTVPASKGGAILIGLLQEIVKQVFLLDLYPVHQSLFFERVPVFVYIMPHLWIASGLLPVLIPKVFTRDC